MPTFAYQAVDTAGKRLRGRAEAASPELLLRSLADRGVVVVDVTTADDAAGARGLGARFGRQQAVLEATRALAALLPAGMPLARALGVAATLTTGAVADALDAVRRRVERGESIAAALGAYPDLFPPLYVGVVRAGERSGDLDAAFRRLAAQLERDAQLRSRLVSASIYPLLLATVGGIAVLVLVLFVLPRFAELLQGAGARLPRSTAIVLGVATLLSRFWPLVLAGAVAFPLGVVGYLRTADGRRTGARLLLGIPVVRTLRRHALGARFARLVGVLLGGGAPLLAALEDAQQSLGDPLARDEAARVRLRVREGAALHQAIAEGTLFPPLLTQLVAVGEEAARLEQFLLKAADILEEKTERVLQRLVALLEPALIVFFGGVVGLVALSLFQAIYGINVGSFR
ncbi:MAG TPA: type II secretion system F family protein [Gemmatimonadales bacterium]|nr:type II secretion system F family protein [Gemmatimonadales bacterium]